MACVRGFMHASCAVDSCMASECITSPPAQMIFCTGAGCEGTGTLLHSACACAMLFFGLQLRLCQYLRSSTLTMCPTDQPTPTTRPRPCRHLRLHHHEPRPRARPGHGASQPRKAAHPPTALPPYSHQPPARPPPTCQPSNRSPRRLLHASPSQKFLHELFTRFDSLSSQHGVSGPRLAQGHGPLPPASVPGSTAAVQDRSQGRRRLSRSAPCTPCPQVYKVETAWTSHAPPLSVRRLGADGPITPPTARPARRCTRSKPPPFSTPHSDDHTPDHAPNHTKLQNHCAPCPQVYKVETGETWRLEAEGLLHALCHGHEGCGRWHARSRRCAVVARWCPLLGLRTHTAGRAGGWAAWRGPR
jgi:hypothetical protein